ncbi:MAG TPA: glycosyltransferase [Chloroflexota bacterium]|jgi:glycosyltransferase involved in cell wall biosynthesis|nr:glycosyltransferase [Chloroflexota bacterium]
MRLLFLTPQLPYPADKGTRIRNLGLIRELARRHEVAVLSFGEPADRAAAAGLSGICRVLDVLPPPTRPRWRRALASLADPRPDLARRLESAIFGRALRGALAERWDVLQVEGLEMAPHWLALRREGPVPPTVFDAHNAEWVLQARMGATDLTNRRLVGGLYSALQAVKLRRYEGAAVSRADAVAAVSDADAAALDRVGRPRRLAVVPNGVDTAGLARRSGDGDDRTVLFTGTMDYRPNVDAVVWFVGEAWPLVRAGVPDARLRIVGRAPTPTVRALARSPGVEVTGGVADVAPFFGEAAVYVAPLRIGGGSRLKLLEACAHGVPIVSTSLGAEGIDLAPGRDALVADDPASFAGAVVRLLRDRPERRALADAGRALVESCYDWRVLVPRLEALYDELVGDRGPLGPRSGVASA